MNHQFWSSKAIAVSMLLTFIGIANQTSAQGYTQKGITTPISEYIGGYYEALPADYATNPTKKYPLLIFLHGLGEIGDGSAASLPSVLRNGPPKLINQGKFPTSFTVNGEQHSFIVISPQMKNNYRKVSLVEDLLNYVVSKYRVDLSRVYLTGLSMGGGISWIYASSGTGTQRLAAMVVVCGNSNSNSIGINNMATYNLPVWATHNQDDPTVASYNSTNWVNGLNAHVPAINPKALLTMFPVSGHDAWTKTYDPAFKPNGKNVYEWMLTYKRSGATTTISNQAPVANAGTDKNIIAGTSALSVSGSATDADGTISQYAWSVIQSPVTTTLSGANSSTISINLLQTGTYILRLTVTDNNGATDSDDVTINVTSPLVATGVSLPARIEAEAYTAMTGVQKETTKDAGGGQDVGYIDNTDWMDYQVIAPAAGTYTVNFRVATPNTGVQFQVRNAAGTVLATVSVPNTGGYQTWSTTSASVTLPTGAQTIRIHSTSATRWNFNWLEFLAPSTSRPGEVSRIEAEAYTTMAGVQKETTRDTGGGQDVGYIDNTDWMDYTVTTAAAGSHKLSFRIATPNTGVQFQVRNQAGAVLATVSVPATGGYQTWTTVSDFIVNLAAGAQTLRIYSTSATRWNINWFEISADATASTVVAQSVGETTLQTLSSTSFQIYPNPVQDRFILQLNNAHTGQMNVQIIDLAGNIRKQFNLNKTTTSTQVYLSTEGLSAGEYILKVQIGTWVETQKLIKL